jgi:hypothetical protein
MISSIVLQQNDIYGIVGQQNDIYGIVGQQNDIGGIVVQQNNIGGIVEQQNVDCLSAKLMPWWYGVVVIVSATKKTEDRGFESRQDDRF